MTDIARHSPALAASMPSPQLLVRVLLVAVAVGLWLMLLPALLARTGFVMQDHGCQLSAGYRDPITGRATDAGASRPMVSCRAQTL